MSIRWMVSVFLVFGLAGCQTSPPRVLAGAPEFFPMAGAEPLHLPFSEAVRAGSLLFLSGQIGNVSGKLELVPGGIEPETRQVMDHIEAILARHGANLDDVVKCTAFLADMREWPAFNRVYRGYFRQHFPARSAFGATGLALGARVELECIAVLPDAGADRR
ncbi:MAG TPA: Rid family hydrolase [Rhodanobacteraceae bacterium]|nr:Rid family hydrolase [Rhodanobacteraceae bacterium]